MTKYPNRDALRQANDIYLDCMRPFVIHHLKQVPGEIVENLIADALTDEQMDKFLGKLDEDDDIGSAIDFNHFPLIIKNNWLIIRNERNYGFAQRFNEDMDVQSMLWLIRKSRNSCEHRGTKDLDSEFVRVNLFYLADVLGKINRPDQQREVESIRDQLCNGDTAEHLAKAEEDKVELRKRLESVESEKIGLENDLETISTQLEDEKKQGIELAECLKATSDQLGVVKARNSELEKRLEATLDQLKDVELENAAYKKRVETISDQLEAANAEKTKYERALKTASNQLATLKKDNAQQEERLEVASTELENTKAELIVWKERYKRLPPNADTPDSITLQGTVFTKHLNEYHVTGDDISQGFWHYWQSQGREGKQKMRDAGWNVEKVDGEWEVIVSPEDFQAWIVNEVTELNSLLDFLRDGESSTQSIQPFYERTSLPMVREMVQPALRVLADRKEHRRVEIIDYLTEHFSLTDDERSYLSKTGQAEKHLMNKGLIERTRTGYYRITTLGLISSGTNS